MAHFGLLSSCFLSLRSFFLSSASASLLLLFLVSLLSSAFFLFSSFSLSLLGFFLPSFPRGATMAARFFQPASGRALLLLLLLPLLLGALCFDSAHAVPLPKQGEAEVRGDPPQ
jgi:hypothetical protein